MPKKTCYPTLFIQKHIHHLYIAMKTGLFFQIAQNFCNRPQKDANLILSELGALLFSEKNC